MSLKTDPRVDAIIADAPEFARPILTHLRQLVHAGCPEAAETIKWGRCFFEWQGRPLCNMAAFKAHCSFGFWGSEMSAVIAREGGTDKGEEGAGQFGRLKRLEDLPDDATLLRYLALAVQFVESGGGATVRSRPAVRRPEAEVPADLATLLAGHPKAAMVFEAFSPSHRREYIEWITEAKRDETRQKRLASTLEWLTEGKPRHWKAGATSPAAS